MTLDTIIKKLEVNESTISTVLGGLVLFAVGFLLYSYFSANRPQPQADLNLDQDTLSDANGQISATSVTSYTVKAGDNLWKIAEAVYSDGYKWVDIARANNLDNPNVIEAGTQLDIPRGQSTANSQAALEDLQQDKAGATPNTYTVKKGDYLWRIAQDLYDDGYRWSEIWQLNKGKIPDPSLIETGQVLTLPQ